MFKRILSLCVLSCFLTYGNAQRAEVYPPNWFVGMQDTTLQLLIHQPKIGIGFQKLACNDSAVKIVSAEPAAHPDYVKVKLAIKRNASPRTINLVLNSKQKIPYSFKQKKYKPQTLRGNDAIYLIMPDRFANGNPANDIVKGMREQIVDRKALYKRHGGDLAGIAQYLDYIDSLGTTALWLTPFQENDEQHSSYHGYAITNHYKVDPRLGTMRDYLALRDSAFAHQQKWILDMVFNHIGDGSFLFTDKPFANGIHQFDSFTQTNYRANTLMDPYHSTIDQKIFTEGWFDKHMPDVNNDDEDMARWMIQQTLWWIETARADALRIDTYSYPEQAFMEKWYQAVIKEYPTMSVFGEIWEHAVPLQSYFVPKTTYANQHMQHVLDFQFCFAIDDVVNNEDGWTDGVSKLYYTLSQDYVYNDAYHHVIFVDNHDLDRFFSVIGYDLQKWKAAMNILCTTRGIPALFYGSEIVMQHKGEHGAIREDMPGGWASDTVSVFTQTGLTPLQQEAYAHLKMLLQWRGNQPALRGKLMQYVPANGVYVYFRYTDEQTIMVVYNSKPTDQVVSLNRFVERLNGFTQFESVLENKQQPIGKTLTVPAKQTVIFTLKR